MVQSTLNCQKINNSKEKGNMDQSSPICHLQQQLNLINKTLQTELKKITNDAIIEIRSPTNKLLEDAAEIIEPPPEYADPIYDMNEQYADLLMIFPEADPVYLREVVEEICSDSEEIIEFVQSKLENPDYPTREEYSIKKEITEKKQCTTDFQVQQFVETFPDSFLQECAFIQHKTELRQYMDDIKAKEQEEFNELKARNKLLECRCCYNECMPSKCFPCWNGHIFCSLCIVRGTNIVLRKGDTRVECLLEHCFCDFPITVLRRVLPPTKFNILLCKLRKTAMPVITARRESLIFCPLCCFGFKPKGIHKDKIFNCPNPDCMQRILPVKCNLDYCNFDVIEY